MSKQCKQMLSMQNETYEDHLLEMSEETKRYDNQIDEGFVWVNLPEAEPDDTIRESITEYQLPLDGSSSNIVQSRIEYTSAKEEPTDQSCCDSDVHGDSADEEILEAQFIDQCKRNKVKSFQSHKLKYPKPNWMKIYERGIFGKEKRMRENKNFIKQENELLPKMKLDALTTQVLESLMYNGYLGQMNELVYTGKNSIVFHAYCSRNNCITTPFNIAVKIYKISKDEGKNKVIYKQVQKEVVHLNILQQVKKIRDNIVGPIRARKNVILLGFVGSEQVKFGTIQDYPCEYSQAVYNNIVDCIDICYNDANLVHGNLSAKKILYWVPYTGKPVLQMVGWSKSVKRNHPMALPKLMRDCQFVTEFFESKDVAVQSTIDLFKQITRKETVEGKLSEMIEGKNLLDKYNTNPNRRNTNLTKPCIYRFK